MKKETVISLSLPEELCAGVELLRPILDFTVADGEGILVSAAAGDENKVLLADGRAAITYTARHMFFRLFGLLLEHAGEASWEVREQIPFRTVGMMLDASRGAVPTVASCCRMLGYLAVMGYNMEMLYTEDSLMLTSELTCIIKLRR